MKKFIQFIKDCRRELVEKTTWPTKDAVLNTTVVVIISIIVVSAALFGVDYLSNKLVHAIVVERVDWFRAGLDWVFYPIFGVPLRMIGGFVAFFLLTYGFNWFKRRLAS